MTERKIENKQFILLRGLPGSGKSTKARELAGDLGQVFASDDFFCMNTEKEYRFDLSKLGIAHAWNKRRSLFAIKTGVPIVVVDNTNTTLKELRGYLPHIELAQELGYDVRIEESETFWRFDVEELFKRNTHNVPKETIQKMLNRYAKDVTVEDILNK